MTFIDNMKNIQPLEFNNTFINGTSSEVTANVINNANVTTGGLWFSISIIVLFILLTYLFMDKKEGFLLDLPRTLLVSSSWCLIISIIAALATFSVTIQPIIWFSTIFFLSWIGVMLRKQKNA